MKKLLITFSVALISLSAAAFVSAQQKRLVGNLNNNDRADGCGCYASFNKANDNARRFIFFSSDEDNDNDAWMNISGRDTKLRLVKETNPKGKLKRGSRFTDRYSAGDITIDVVRIVTRVCPPRDEGCEVTDFATTFTVKKGNRTQVVQAVGSCGC